MKRFIKLHTRFIAFFIITFFCGTMKNMAQSPRLYTLNNGLSSSYVNYLYSDKDNFIWVVTSESLEIFDGNGFHVINYNDPATGGRIFDVVNCISQIDDERYWVLTNIGAFIFNARTNEFERIKMTDDEPQLGFSFTQVLDFPGKDLKVIPSDGFGTFIYNTKEQKVDTMLTKKLKQLLPSTYICELFIDGKKQLWTNDVNHRICLINCRKWKNIELNITDEAQKILNDGYVKLFLEDKIHNKIYMAMTKGGVLVYDNQTNIVREINGNRRDFYTLAMLLDASGRLLVGTDNFGLWEMNRNDETLKPVNVDIDNLDFQHAKIHSLAQDKEGNIVVGLFQKGLLVLPSQKGGFDYIPLSVAANGKNSSCVTDMTVDKNGDLWCATDGSGVFRTPKEKNAVAQPMNDGLKSMSAQTVVVDKHGTVWCGTWNGGVQYFDGNSFKAPDFFDEYEKTSVMSLAYDKVEDKIYAGTNGEGLIVIDAVNKTAHKANTGEDMDWIDLVYMDSDRQLWVSDAVYNYCYDLKNGKCKPVTFSDKQIYRALSFEQDGDNMLIGTNFGLFCVNRETKEPVEIKEFMQTKNMRIKAIQPVKNGVWITTDKGLAFIGKNDDNMTLFKNPGGKNIGEFHAATSLQLPNGTLMFGGDNGIIRFKTDDFTDKEQKIKEIFFTELFVGNEEKTYNAEDKDNVTDANILYATKIKLKRGDNTFRIKFSVPEFGDPYRIFYSYILEGYEKIWHDTDAGDPQAYYASLSPGTYTFRVRAYLDNANINNKNSQNFCERTIKVVVPYPWYATWWAYLIYALLAAIIGYYIYKNIKERQKQRNLLRVATQNEQIKEAKLRLFTSIAHELRSPLTMIISPLKELIRKETDENKIEDYNIMQRNCNRLLNIVNQISDVRKIDNGQFKLHFSQVEFLKYEEDIMAAFKGMAAAKNISFTAETEDKAMTAWIDTMHFEKILVNLLSNAFKFTPNGGKISVKTLKCDNTAGADGKKVFDDDRIKQYMDITVYNSGSHIDENDLAHVYERFYQGNDGNNGMGSGIGLNLTNELVKLHHGTIEVHNVNPDGVEFVVKVPLGNAHLSQEELTPRDNHFISKNSNSDKAVSKDSLAETVADIQKGTANAETDLVNQDNAEKKEKTSVLVVDDDVELLDYIRNSLVGDYNVNVAKSGNEAWGKILTYRPDIVITDLMMPDGNGYDLCKRIKNNPETDDVAVIVLTSEANEDNQLMSMDLQADHFLSKPFNIQILKSALVQVKRTRDNIINKLRRNQIDHDYSKATINSADETLIKRVHEAVMKHLDDSDFGVEELSREVGVSRVHLNRKLKDLCNISPSAYIRTVRLKQAAYLMVNKKVYVSDVAYNVGFSSLSYFSTQFHEFFGMTPKEFMAAYSENADDETLAKLLE